MADANGGRQQPIDGAAEVVGRDWVFERYGGDLGKGMNAGIGAARSDHLDGLAFQAADDLFEYTLNRRQAGLRLPAMKGSTVVGDLKA